MYGVQNFVSNVKMDFMLTYKQVYVIFAHPIVRNVFIRIFCIKMVGNGKSGVFINIEVSYFMVFIILICTHLQQIPMIMKLSVLFVMIMKFYMKTNATLMLIVAKLK